MDGFWEYIEENMSQRGYTKEAFDGVSMTFSGGPVSPVHVAVSKRELELNRADPARLTALALARINNAIKTSLVMAGR